MSKTPASLAITLMVLIAAPAASFAQMAGAAGTGNVPISGIPPGPANAGGLNNVIVDPSGIGNASKMAPAAAAKYRRASDSAVQVKGVPVALMGP